MVARVKIRCHVQKSVICMIFSHVDRRNNRLLCNFFEPIIDPVRKTKTALGGSRCGRNLHE